jgi:hypothetical protein
VELAEADMSRTPDPDAAVGAIVEHLWAGGASDLRAATDRVWIVGRAPSGASFELYWWPKQGYCVSRHLSSSDPGQQIGVFPAWEAAVACALQA